MNQNDTDPDELEDDEFEDDEFENDEFEDEELEDDEFEDDEFEDDEFEDDDELEDEDDDSDDVDRYLAEYRKTLSAFAGFADKHPDMVGELRRVLKISANLTVSNRPGVAESVRDAAEDIDVFLKQVEAGELKAEDFITEESDKTEPKS